MILTWLIFLPCVFALIASFFPRGTERMIWITGILGTIATLIVSIMVLREFDATNTYFQFEQRLPWLPQLGIEYHLGIDGISIWLVMLTTLLCPVALYASMSSIEARVKEFVIFYLLLETAMLGAFLSLNMILFYVFWEAMLIPMFFMIGIWGGKDRIYATIKFFLFTFIGSLLMLAAMVYLFFEYKSQFNGQISFFFNDLYKLYLPFPVQALCFGAFFLAFAVKVPMFPVHTWLPDAHVQAPTPGSVILAGVLLKMGTYGFMRLAMPLFPEASKYFTLPIMILAVIGIVYGALVAYVQQDVKKLVAYSSVSHLGYIMLGLFTLNIQGVQGGLIQMINHGISTGALFLLVGMIYERRHTRDINAFGGLAKQMPRFAVLFIIVMLSSVALPLTNGFTGEFNILLGSYKYAFDFFHETRSAWVFALPVLAGLGVILGAVYMLHVTQKMFFGPLENPENKDLEDLTNREVLILVPFVIAIFYLGLNPNGFFRNTESSVKQFIQIAQMKGEKQ